MPRPPKCRRVCALPRTSRFLPDGGEGEALLPVVLLVDEYEAIRLIDLEGLSQEECAQQMEVARSTVSAIYDSARKKIAQSIVGGRRLTIEGGNYRLGSEEERPHRHRRHCRRMGRTVPCCAEREEQEKKESL